jgi:DnaJ domain
MPTRRVALASSYLPTIGAAHGATLLGAVVSENIAALDEDQRDDLPRLLADLKREFEIPRIALRHRLQIDQHGLDHSTHRVVGENGVIVVELDVHGARVPQILGACMAVATLPLTSRTAGLRVLRAAVEGRFRLAAGVRVRRSAFAANVSIPMAGVSWNRGAPIAEQSWVGVPSEQRWAMEVLGLGVDATLETNEINRRFRRLLRQAHPDHGGNRSGAAERIAELSEARDVLLAFHTNGSSHT